MSFFQLVRREMQGSLDRLAVMSGLGGVSNAAILAAINSGAQAAGNGEVIVWRPPAARAGPATPAAVLSFRRGSPSCAACPRPSIGRERSRPASLVAPTEPGG